MPDADTAQDGLRREGSLREFDGTGINPGLMVPRNPGTKPTPSVQPTPTNPCGPWAPEPAKTKSSLGSFITAAPGSSTGEHLCPWGPILTVGYQSTMPSLGQCHSTQEPSALASSGSASSMRYSLGCTSCISGAEVCAGWVGGCLRAPDSFALPQSPQKDCPGFAGGILCQNCPCDPPALISGMKSSPRTGSQDAATPRRPKQAERRDCMSWAAEPGRAGAETAASLLLEGWKTHEFMSLDGAAGANSTAGGMLVIQPTPIQFLASHRFS